MSIQTIIQQDGKRPPSNFNIRSGRLLRLKRAAAGMSMEVVASRIGVSWQSMQKYENGKSRINLELAVKLGRIIGFDPALFLKEVMRDETPIADVRVQMKDAAVRKVSDAMAHISRREDRELLVDLARRLAEDVSQ